MALGGGTFTSQNKVLPGSYINFVSAARATATLSERGVAAIALSMNWGKSGVFMVTSEDLIKNSLKIFGYPYDADELAQMRDLFCNATKVFLYRLNGDGVKASNTFCDAKYAGTRGNDIKTVIQVNVDDNTKVDVITYLGTIKVDSQTVSAASGLSNNDFVDFKSGATLEVTSGTSLTGGTNSEVTGTNHSNFLAAIESYSFNCIGVVSDDATTNGLYVAFTKRMRDEVGVKFVCVVYNKAADYEGVINVKNCKEIIPWVIGAEAGCAVNQSCTNKKYDGEAEVLTAYTQAQLESTINAGEFTLHQVGNEIRVLTDINSLTTVTSDKGADFKSNQSIRVMDQIANDIAVMFSTKYLGSISNNIAGRSALWLDIVKHHKELQTIGAIEGFSDSDVTVEQGESKKSVVVTDKVTVINAMEQLYMTVTIA